MRAQGIIYEINGPIITIEMSEIANGHQVKIGKMGLIGEVIALQGKYAIIQCYENTEGLRPGETVTNLGHPLSVELGPGLVGEIFDGVQRRLKAIYDHCGDNMPRGVDIAPLDRERRWAYQPLPELKPGDQISGGTIIGVVQETQTISHRIMVPPGISGELVTITPEGEYDIEQPMAVIKDKTGTEHTVKLYQRWPVRRPRPYQRRDHAVLPLITGQRILDTFFPLLKGGKAAVPGPFGAGKTMVQHQIARWTNADIVVYVGCGERGNELVDILESFPELIDPYTGRKLMERTLMIANTSNMPVVAREASIYVGVTISEYFRDQGYDVVMLADSTSRWAEALREVSGRLGQMPVEEGYPAYLSSRLAAFYERAGRVHTLGGDHGSVSLIGAVSPPGGDFSEPVTSHTKEIVQAFWALSKELADSRHYPAIDWVGSFSGHVSLAAKWWADEIDPHWERYREEALKLLARDAELLRIVNLVGPEALSSAQRWELESAALIKEGILQQSALDEVDTFCSPQKQYVLLELVIAIYQQGAELVKKGLPVEQLTSLPQITKVKRLKGLFNSDQVEEIRVFAAEVMDAIEQLRQECEQVKVDR